MIVLPPICEVMQMTVTVEEMKSYLSGMREDELPYIRYTWDKTSSCGDFIDFTQNLGIYSLAVRRQANSMSLKNHTSASREEKMKKIPKIFFEKFIEKYMKKTEFSVLSV